MKIVGHEVTTRVLVTGCIVAVLGSELTSGDFETIDIRFPEYAIQPPLPSFEDSEPRYIALVSGLSISKMTNSEIKLQLLQEFLSGELGGEKEKDITSKIAHLIIAGNSLSDSVFEDCEITTGFGTLQVNQSKIQTDLSQISSDPSNRLDQFLNDIVATVPVSIMPGETDLSNVTLPQQPLHPALFQNSRRFQNNEPSFNSVTNPNLWNFNDIHILGHSGQPINDMCKYIAEKDVDRLDLMNQTLRWQIIVPTAPDTLGMSIFFFSWICYNI